MRRFIWHRDGGRCQTPGCRSAFGLEIHHIEPRADGGTHDASNLTLRCGGCHRANHEGRLTITGTAPDRLITRRREHVGASSPVADEPIARRVVDAAAAPLGREAPLEVIIGEALAGPLPGRATGADVCDARPLPPDAAPTGAEERLWSARGAGLDR